MLASSSLSQCSAVEFLIGHLSRSIKSAYEHALVNTSVCMVLHYGIMNYVNSLVIAAYSVDYKTDSNAYLSRICSLTCVLLCTPGGT